MSVQVAVPASSVPAHAALACSLLQQMCVLGGGGTEESHIHLLPFVHTYKCACVRAGLERSSS